MFLICSFEKKKIGNMIHEKLKKKNRKMLKKRHYLQQQLESHFWPELKFGFLYFNKSCRELNFLSKNINPKSIGILSSKLWPKYKTGAEDNTNSTSSSIFFQNFKWGSTSNLFKLIYWLIPSLNFRRKFFWKINWIEKQIHSVKIFKNA